MAQILRIDCPLFKRGLSLPQRLAYFNAMIHFFFGVPRLIMILAHQVPLVRPDDVLAGLQVASPKFAPIDPPVLTRLAQGRLDLGSGLITEPGH